MQTFSKISWSWYVLLSIWLGLLILFNWPSLDWRIGVFHSGDWSLLVPSMYGLAFNGLIYFGNIYYLIPRYLSNGLYLKYIGLLILYFISISLIESLLDVGWFWYFYEEPGLAIIREILETSILLNFLFILLPSFFHRFAMDWLKAQKQLINTDTGDKSEMLVLKSGTEIHQVPVEDVILLESDGNYVKVQTVDKRILVRDSLTKMISSLPPEKFIRCHKSFVVARHAVTKFTYDQISLEGIKVPVGRVYRAAVKEFLSN